MKVGYVLKKFPRLSETFILNELLSLEKLGHEIEIVSLRHPDEEPRHEALRKLKAPIHYLDRSPAKADSRPEYETLANHLQRVYGDRAARRLNQGAALKRLADERGFEHIHCHFMTVAAHVAALARSLGGPTFTVTAHAKDIFRRGIDEELFRYVKGLAHGIITVSDFNAAYIARRFCFGDATNIQRIYNGLPLSDPEYQEAPLIRDENHFLTVGRLVPKKGIDLLLQALAGLKDSGLEASLTIIGEGECRESLSKLARSLKIDDRVRFLGAMPREKVFQMMRRATLFVLPCREGEDGNRDALPTVLIEAMALGLPVISTEFVGIPEIIRDGEQGRLVPVEDRVALQSCMAWTLEHEDWRREATRLGPIRARRVFDAAVTARELSDRFEVAKASLEARP